MIQTVSLVVQLSKDNMMEYYNDAINMPNAMESKQEYILIKRANGYIKIEFMAFASMKIQGPNPTTTKYNS